MRKRSTSATMPGGAMHAPRGALPWYREPWPWILMSGPIAVILAGAVTGWLALKSYDGLIADDYYKQGLEVNQVLARGREAAARGIEGALRLDRGGAFELAVRSARGPLPAAIRITLSHPTRADLDQQVRVSPAAQGIYAGRMGSLAPGRWKVIVEDPAATWRIRGELRVPGDVEVELRPAQ